MRFLFALLLIPLFTSAQTKLIVKDKVTNLPIIGATVKANNKAIAITDSSGVGIINAKSFSVAAFGYLKTDTSVQESLATIYLMPDVASLDNVTVVASTRNNASIETSPLRVEVLNKEELNEEDGIKPGNIASILGDVSGVQIQQSSATSGNANVRIQGLEGRYTQILRDGIPLYGGY